MSSTWSQDIHNDHALMEAFDLEQGIVIWWDFGENSRGDISCTFVSINVFKLEIGHIYELVGGKCKRNTCQIHFTLLPLRVTISYLPLIMFFFMFRSHSGPYA